MAVVEDLGAALATAGVGAVGSTLFYNQMPSAPHNCVVLHEYSGNAPEFALPSTGGVATEHPRVQITSRATTEAIARSKAQTAYETLAKVANQTLTTTRYLRVEPLQAPFFLRKDENERWLFVFNVEVEKAL